MRARGTGGRGAGGLARWGGRLTGFALPFAGALLRGVALGRTEAAARIRNGARRFGSQHVLVEPAAAAGKRPDRGGIPAAESLLQVLRQDTTRRPLAAEPAPHGPGTDIQTQ